MSHETDPPGSEGEREVQRELGTRGRAESFYDQSMKSELTDRMVSFVEERIMFFLSTADSNGETDCSPRVGPKGFVEVIDGLLYYPEFRGNGVNASLGNVRENPNATLLFVDWWDTTVGLHVNGTTTIREDEPGGDDSHAEDDDPTDKVKLWVEVEVEEAYIHCAKHIPKLSVEEFDPPWGTDDEYAKKAGFFTN